MILYNHDPATMILNLSPSLDLIVMLTHLNQPKAKTNVQLNPNLGLDSNLEAEHVGNAKPHLHEGNAKPHLLSWTCCGSFVHCLNTSFKPGMLHEVAPVLQLEEHPLTDWSTAPARSGIWRCYRIVELEGDCGSMISNCTG